MVMGRRRGTGDTGAPPSAASAIRSLGAGVRRLPSRIRATGQRGLLAVVGGLLVAAFLAGGLAQVRIETGVASYLPPSDPSLQRLDDLSRSFGGDPIVVLLESPQPRQLLAQGQLEPMLALEKRLAGLPDTAALYGPVTTLNELAGQAQNLIAEVIGQRDGLVQRARSDAAKRGASPAEADAAARDATTAFDARYGPLVIDALPTGLPTLRNPKLVDNIVFGKGTAPRPRWQYVIPSANSLAILVRPRADLDQQSTENLVHSVEQAAGTAALPPGTRVTVTGVPAVVATLGTSVGAQLPVLGVVAVAAIGLVLFLVPWTERRRRLLPLAVTVLATGLTVACLGWVHRPLSIGVLAFLPVLVGLGSYYPTYFAQRARTRTVFVVAAGTALSFATLALAPLAFVRDLGIALALGIVLAVGLSVLLVRRDSATPPPSSTPGPAPFGTRAPTLPARTRYAIGAGVAVVALAGWATLGSLPLLTNIQDLAQGLPVLDDANHARDVIGTDGELDVVLTDDGNPATPPPDVRTAEAWKWMQTAQQQIVVDHGDRMKPAISPPSLLGFLGDDPTTDQIQAGLRLMPDYLTNAVLRQDGQVAVMSFGVSLDDLQGLSALVDQVRTELPPPPPGTRVELTGLPTVAVQGYQLVSGDRYFASIAGVVVAGLVLLVGLRRRADAGRAVAAAVIATGVELLFLWVTQIPLNPLTVALGSLTAAVGCEFTAMVSQSARHGDGNLRRAVLLAAVTSGVGYAVLALSPLALIRQFGFLLAGSVALAYLAAHFVVWVWPPSPADDEPARPDHGGSPDDAAVPAPRNLSGVS